MARSRFPECAGVLVVTMSCALSPGRLTAETAPALAAGQALAEVSGTYVDSSVEDDCDLRATSGGSDAGTRAATVVYWRGLLTLRVVPTRTIRALHIRKRALSARVGPGGVRNGLARWEAGELVVESTMPALPLWSGPVVPGSASTLVERFSFSETAMTYQAEYLRADGTGVGDPFELTLTRCTSLQ